ncbi:MAG: UbiD family decarboxylase [Alphaproteobacteria bacterium]|nr:UbiD family decarboxylase [Alphaproteobacteria bacterium]
MATAAKSKPRARAAGNALDADLRGYLESNADILTVVDKAVSIDNIGALSAQSDNPILFNNIIEYPDFRLCDILVKHRWSQCRALGVEEKDYLPTLAHRLRKPPRGFVDVKTGPVKEVIWKGKEADWLKLPIPIHSEQETERYVSAMNIVKDPETGFYNSSHAGTQAVGPHKGLISFVTPHTHIVIQKYLAQGKKEMPIALVFGVPPAYEIMGNFSGLHMDLWGEMEMVGTIMDQDIEMVPCETIDLTVPAHAEIVVEATVNLVDLTDVGVGVSPSMYYLPKSSSVPELTIHAITMRKDRPIYRNHQTCPDTDHQTLPRLCHEAVLYNRLSEIGLKVHDVRFPTWGAALSCIVQIEAPRAGLINDGLMQTMGAPWLNTKMVVAISPDTDINSPAEVYHAIASRCDPATDIFIVDNTRGSPYDPSAKPIDDFWRTVGKIGIDATVKSHHNAADFERSWPLNWGKVNLSDYL